VTRPMVRDSVSDKAQAKGFRQWLGLELRTQTVKSRVAESDSEVWSTAGPWVMDSDNDQAQVRDSESDKTPG
jgi:hypothetical protein